MRRVLLLLPFLLAGCAETRGAECSGTAPVGGTWEYHGTLTLPAPGATLSGNLDVNSVDGCDFTGPLNIDETPSGGGSPIVHTGTLFGIAVSDSVVNFDAQLSTGATWTHVARVYGDSMAGDLHEGSATRGTFWARRTAP